MHSSPRRPAVPLAAALLAVLGVLGLLVGGAAPASASAADDQVAWAVRTASNDFGADRQNYSYTLSPGGTLRDGIVVVNHGTEPIDLAVYAADGFTTEGGQLDLLTPGTESTGVGRWLSVGRDRVRVQPEESVTVPFRVTLPDNATPGDHVGGIITSLARADEVEGINVDRRLALKVRLRAGGELSPALTVEDLHVSHDGTLNPAGTGSATVEYTVHNTGNAILSAQQAVSVSGPFGLLGTDAAAVAATPELLPGESWTVSVPVPGIRPTGRLSADVRLTPLLTDASGSVAPLDAVERTAHAWAVPWTLLVALVLLVAAVAGGVVRSRRRRAVARSREDDRVRAAVEAALGTQTPAHP